MRPKTLRRVMICAMVVVFAYVMVGMWFRMTKEVRRIKAEQEATQPAERGPAFNVSNERGKR